MERYEETELSGGRAVRVYGGSPWLIQKYLIEWEAENPRPVAPSEQIKTADGVVDTKVYRRDPDYLAAVNAWHNQREIAKDVPLVNNALKDELPDDETLWNGEWVQAHKRAGLEVPEDEARRKYEYLRTEVLRTDVDVALVGALANLQTFPQEESIKARMRGFPSPSTGGRWMNMRTRLAGLMSKARGTSTLESPKSTG